MARRGMGGLVGRQGVAGPGGVGGARRVLVGRRGEVWLGRDGTVGWQAIVPLGLSGRDS